MSVVFNRGFEAPTFQSFINYVLLALVYIPVSLNAKMENSVFSREGGNLRASLIAKFIILAVVNTEFDLGMIYQNMSRIAYFCYQKLPPAISQLY